MYFVELSIRAQKFLDKLDNNTKEIIEKRLKNLEDNPIPSDSKFPKFPAFQALGYLAFPIFLSVAYLVHK